MKLQKSFCTKNLSMDFLTEFHSSNFFPSKDIDSLSFQTLVQKKKNEEKLTIERISGAESHEDREFVRDPRYHHYRSIFRNQSS